MNENTKKIKCSVGILTLNSEAGLLACLESMKDFAEIVICDGNSTDKTVEIAKAYGAKVIRQYNTDLPNLPCMKDKADMCQKNMEACSYDWHFRMDSDDTLSPDVVEEIRSIVSNPNPPHLIYRMPTRIFFEEGDKLREIKYEATYPSYHIRLSHKSVGMYFKGDVHNRPSFDEKRFPIGTMKGYYDFHWPERRVKNFWAFLKKYADTEASTGTFDQLSFVNYIRWGLYWRFRTIFGYLIYRLPLMYMRHGFKETMPIGIELNIVRYHFRILWGSFKEYFNARKWYVYFREILKGKDTNRILTNIALMKKSCMGNILDIGGGKGRASHYRFLRMFKWNKITSIDISANAKPDYVLDVEKEKLPFDDESFDYVFLFNVLEHLDNREDVLSEIRRVLKKIRSDGGPHLRNRSSIGELIGVIPFMVNVHPDPKDFVRLTEDGLRSIFGKIGFSNVEIIPVGIGPFTAGYYQIEFMIPRIIRLILGPMIFLFDLIISKVTKINLKEKFPLSYIFYASK